MKMTVKQARKILGVMANNLSDEQLEVEIQNSIFFAELFFEYRNKFKKSINSC